MSHEPAESLPILVNALQSGKLPLLVYLNKLETHFNQRELDVFAFLPEEGRFDRLRREAIALLEQYPQPDARPPLFGVPVGVKDIFQVDGFTTRAGSRLPPAHLQGPEAESVATLRRAGALILGKTVSTEFAYFAPGPTRNPHNPAYTPGGSSSGSAAAVAANLCPLALGTQTIGSIARPAAYCGVVGFKPSYERISRAGVIPLSPSLDHVGFFTSDVVGAEVATSLLCRHWQLVVTPRKPILGVPEGPYLQNAGPEALAHFRECCDRLRADGYTILPVAAMADYDDIATRHNLIVAAEAAQVHQEWYLRHHSLYHAKTAELIESGQGVSTQELERALAGRRKLREELTVLMDQQGLDLWLSPAAPGAAPQGLDSTGNPVMNLPWTHSGLPTITLPSGMNGEGMPLGLQIAGRWYDDETVLAWAAEIESVLRQ